PISDSLEAILQRATERGYSTDNLTFGMGGGLLQRLNRDTQKFALKCSATRVNGVWRDVYKEPVTDPGKVSKRGRLTLLRHAATGEYTTLGLPPAVASSGQMSRPEGGGQAPQTVWRDG